MNGLTDKQGKLLMFIAERLETQGYAPTVREMCERFGWRSSNAAACNLDRLIHKGYVTRPPLKRRVILFTRLAQEWLGARRNRGARPTRTGIVEPPWQCWSCNAASFHVDTCAMCRAPRRFADSVAGRAS